MGQTREQQINNRLDFLDDKIEQNEAHLFLLARSGYNEVDADYAATVDSLERSKLEYERLENELINLLSNGD